MAVHVLCGIREDLNESIYPTSLVRSLVAHTHNAMFGSRRRSRQLTWVGYFSYSSIGLPEEAHEIIVVPQSSKGSEHSLFP